MHLKAHHFRKLNFRAIAAAAILILANTAFVSPASAVTAEQKKYLDCTDFKFVFARGSGAEVNSDRDFKPFKAAVDEVFKDSGYTYSFYELGSLPGGWGGQSYPAPGIGVSTWQRFTTSLGALLSGGESSDYGDSVETGAYEAATYLFMLNCPNTKVVLAGYSQGAQVVSRTLQILESEKTADKVFAALTFGDPKLYLPEGKYNYFTQTTAACQNKDLSEYRAFVPDCYTYQGILGGYNPYQPSKFSGKLKTYCQWHDVICSSYIDLNNLSYGHASYAEQGTYLRGIQDVYNMVKPATYSRPNQDVAIMFDVTGSMGPLLAQFQREAIAVAKKTIDRGGKVALYTYGDLATEGRPIQLCNFETCNSGNVEGFIRNIKVDGGGDIPESVLSSSYTLMRELNWEVGANKSLVVLTDANYHNPDRDGITEADVVRLSKSIDPVNFYILTTPEYASSYTELASLTDGGVYTSDVSSALGDIETEILSRETPALYLSEDLPTPSYATITDLKLEKTSDSSVKVSFTTDGVMGLVSIDDFVAGYTEETTFNVTDLDLSEPVTICIAPVSASGFRSDSTCVSTGSAANIVIPKAPNTGKYK